ncbi:MAG: type II toxin-antitoxin system VapC family toxin [Methylocystis sp.]|nr:type II toxin-antitoxin system VapC family toxin [Methylocystis sp.]
MLVDTSVWIDHFRRRDAALVELLENGRVLSHPFVIGELALGNLKQRAVILNALRSLPAASVATEDEVMALIDAEKLFGLGVGYIDAHLLAGARLSNASLGTRDKKPRVVAAPMPLAAHGRKG